MRNFLILVLGIVSLVMAQETPPTEKTVAEVCKAGRTKDVVCSIPCSKSYIRCSSNRTLEIGLKGNCPPNLPYCTPNPSSNKNDYCSAMPPASCPDLLDFECTSDGVFANPANCNTFFSCRVNKNETTAKTMPFIRKLFACNDNEKFNPKNKVTYCNPLTTADKACVAINCKGVQDGTILQVRNLDDYVVCMQDKAHSYVCPENTQFTPMQAPISCSFVCPRIGKFPNEFDDSSFYDCRCSGITCASNNAPVYCKSGQFFNAISLQCELNLDRALRKRK